MVSILTLTYQRHELLEEAIYSYLLQIDGYEDETEMVVINDSPDVQYIFYHPNVRVINCRERFSSVGKKLEWGFSRCKGEWIYRLDDDDLLSPYALELNKIYRREFPDKDILRDEKHYFFSDNKFEGLSGSVNNGNCYNHRYIKRVGSIVDISVGEDSWLTFSNNADIHSGDTGRYTMIYRWGMGTYHISGMENDYVYEGTDMTKKEFGIINLDPRFENDYWSQIM